MIPRFSAFIEVSILGVYSNNIYNEYTHGNDISETYVQVLMNRIDCVLNHE